MDTIGNTAGERGGRGRGGGCNNVAFVKLLVLV